MRIPRTEWKETASTVTVIAECGGASAADVFSSPHYVSVNAPPYFLEIDLHGAIDGTRSVATVQHGSVILKLFKACEGGWGRLHADLPRAELFQRRESSRAIAAAETQAGLERKKRAQWDDSRFVLGKQMDKDRAGRQRIDLYKVAEKEAESAELERWKVQTEATCRTTGHAGANLRLTTPIVSRAARHGGTDDLSRAAGVAGKPMSDLRKHTEHTRPPEGAATARKEAQGDLAGICDVVDVFADVPPLSRPGGAGRSQRKLSNEVDKAMHAANTAATASMPMNAAKTKHAVVSKSAGDATGALKRAALPPPRAVTKVAVGFTKQLLSAPARTKTTNADYDLPPDPLTAPSMLAGRADGDISQRDPAWLKDRGDRYFSMGDWRSAEEAYTLVLAQFASSIMGQAIDCVTACYSNRAACRLQTKKYTAAAADCGHALAIMSKAVCVTEYPKSDAARARCRLRLLARRGAAYARAGVLHRALTDLRLASGLAEGPMPSDAADRQMLATDAQAVAQRQDEVISLLETADALLADAQASAVAVGPPSAGALKRSDVASSQAALRAARALYDEALKKAPLDVAALTSRAACALCAGEPSACVDDCTSALCEIDAEENRAEESRSEYTGMFAPPPPPQELTTLTDALAEKADMLRFELLCRRGAARVEQGETHYSQAALDFKGALKLRPAETSVMTALDDLARRAMAAGVELEALPPAPPAQGLALKAESEGGGGAEQEGVGHDSEVAAAPAVRSDGGEATPSTASAQPPVGTRSAAQLKDAADRAFREMRLGKAATLYGKALKADAGAEWLGEGDGILFRCQCLANRSACHLKLGAFLETINDAGAAIAALGTGIVRSEQSANADALLLKLLARRGMALCQLTRYDEAASDYARAVELDPENEQLNADFKLIEAARTQSAFAA